MGGFWSALCVLDIRSFPDENRFKDAYTNRYHGDYGDEVSGLSKTRAEEFHLLMQGSMRRAAKRGTTVRTGELDDELIRGITEIYNETPFRQGKKFPHYGKDFATLKKEISTLLDPSEFIGAYFENELITSACGDNSAAVTAGKA